MPTIYSYLRNLAGLIWTIHEYACLQHDRLSRDTDGESFQLPTMSERCST